MRGGLQSQSLARALQEIVEPAAAKVYREAARRPQEAHQMSTEQREWNERVDAKRMTKKARNK